MFLNYAFLIFLMPAKTDFGAIDELTFGTADFSEDDGRKKAMPLSSMRQDLLDGVLGPEELVVNNHMLRARGECVCGNSEFAYDLTIPNNNGRYCCLKCHKPL